MAKVNIDDLLGFFPLVELPVTVSEDSLETFDKMNDVLPLSIIETFIIPWESDQKIDEFTEFVPCFSLPAETDYYSIVYWKGNLLRYEYVLVTLDIKTGALINRKVIAGTIAEENVIKKSVAHIDEDRIIHIVAGAQGSEVSDQDYDPTSSQAFNMEIMSTGDIIFSLGDEEGVLE